MCERVSDWLAVRSDFFMSIDSRGMSFARFDFKTSVFTILYLLSSL